MELESGPNRTLEHKALYSKASVWRAFHNYGEKAMPHDNLSNEEFVKVSVPISYDSDGKVIPAETTVLIRVTPDEENHKVDVSCSTIPDTRLREPN